MNRTITPGATYRLFVTIINENVQDLPWLKLNSFEKKHNTLMEQIVGRKHISGDNDIFQFQEYIAHAFTNITQDQ